MESKGFFMKHMGFIVSSLCLGLLLLGTPAFAAEKNYTNSIGMEFIFIPAGSFMMGCDKNIEDCRDDETPQHRVTLSKDFYLGKYAVTQAQWVAVMGSNPSKFKGPNNPVEQVSWKDAQAFIKLLNRKEGHKRYRLPTEAEWEYAARADTESNYSFGDDAAQLEQYAWYDDEPLEGSTHPVGRKKPNAWGLYDMHGNVWEWVADWYDENYYRKSPGVDPKGPPSGSHRVFRGGGWLSATWGCRSSYRHDSVPGHRYSDGGFRLALSLE